MSTEVQAEIGELLIEQLDVIDPADWTVTAPGLVYDMPDAAYHADPVPGGSLSSTGARAILPPGCPALFKWQHDHGRPDTKAFDLGHAAHALVLGAGIQPVEVEADSWRKDATKARGEEIRAAGGVPLLTESMQTVRAMAEALRAHPFAGMLLNPASGAPEVSAFWRDTRAEVWLRARYDWLPARHDGRLLVTDYKTADSAEPGAFARSAAKFGYHQQAGMYLDGLRALDYADDAAFLFIVQEKKPPYLVSVIELDHAALRVGRARNRRAIDLYAQCKAENDWPAYLDDVALVSLPRWATLEDS